MKHLIPLLIVTLLVSLSPSILAAEDGESKDEFRFTTDVVYGHKSGMALTYDVIQHTARHNDAAVVYMVSGGWNSSWSSPRNFVNPAAPAGFRFFRQLVEKGYTLYIVRHGSAPLFKVPDAVSDVRKALRHIHLHADDFKVDADRIGVCGGSAGGHLSLMLGTTGDDGNAKASTAIDRTGNRVAAVVAYFPPVDLREYVGPDDRFPALDFDPTLAESVSPLLHVTADDAPTLLIHGTEDTLVPLSNSDRIEKAFQDKNVPTKKVVIEGAGHGFGGADGTLASKEMIAWFDTHLAKTPPPRTANKPQKNYPPEMEGAEVETYKTVGDTELKAYVFKPESHEGNESRPAIVFFFGGGWKGGTPAQFEQHCRYLASRGMIAITADYRVASRNQTKATACVMDAKSAIRWVRKNARRLGADPQRIIAGGGSAGGHLAACTATVPGFEEAGDDLDVSSHPNGLALFNPALVLAPVDGVRTVSEQAVNQLRERMGTDPRKLSPLHQLSKGLPPTIIFHGRADSTVPFATARAFADAATANGDIAQLEGYDGEPHGFFNFGRKENKAYLKTMLSLDQFLVDHGLLEGPSPKQIKIIQSGS